MSKVLKLLLISCFFSLSIQASSSVSVAEGFSVIRGLGDIALLQAYFDDDGDVNAVDDDENTLLHAAILSKNLDVIKLLLAQPGINVNKIDGNGQTPLYLAVDYGLLDGVRLLLAQPGIDVNVVDEEGLTPLAIAQDRGYEDIVKLIRGHLAAKAFALVRKPGGFAAVKAFIDAGGDVRTVNEDKNTLLHEAVGAPQGSDIVKLLLAQPNIDVNAHGYNLYTPLHIAAAHRPDMVRLLLAQPNINVNARDHQTYTPLQASVSEGNTEVVKLLLERPDIDVNYGGVLDSRYPPLHLAAYRDVFDVAKLLIDDPRVDIDKHDSHGVTPLEITGLYPGRGDRIKNAIEAQNARWEGLRSTWISKALGVRILSGEERKKLMHKEYAKLMAGLD